MINKRVLRELLVSSYSKDELITLATDIVGNAELVFPDGGTLETQARELVAWCGRRNKIQSLVDQIKKERPEAYEANRKRLEEDADSPLSEVQTASEEIEEAFEAFRSVEIKQETATPKPSQTRKNKHPLEGKQDSIHKWFKQLDPEQQVFIIAAAFFSKLQKDELMYLYSNTLKVLGVSKADDSVTEAQND